VVDSLLSRQEAPGAAGRLSCEWWDGSD
jgi:hypothetical protein